MVHLKLYGTELIKCYCQLKVNININVMKILSNFVCFKIQFRINLSVQEMDAIGKYSYNI